MKKIIIILLFLIFCVACSTSDQIIEEPVQSTHQAEPTVTFTQLQKSTETTTPTITITPTIEVSPTSEVPHIIGLSHEDVLEKYLENGFICGEWKINDEGYYQQSCSGLSNIPDSMIMAEIFGYSEDTVY